jgi:glycosyltransferase involved in cell wall biosynthesis
MSALTAVRRGVYIARLDLTAPHLAGVSRKIDAQSAALQELPARIDRLCLSDGRVELNDQVISDFGNVRLTKRIAYYFGFHFAVASLQSYDFAYIRYQGTSPLMLWALRKLRKKNPGLTVLLEVPTFPYDGKRVSMRDWALWMLEKLFRPFLRFLVDRVVTYSRQEHIFGIRTLIIENGVDVNAIKVVDPPLSERICLLGLANLSFWHGYDRVISGLAEYYATGGKRDVRFFVIGEGNELPRLRQRVESTALGERVSFLGSLTGPALESAARDMQIGISCLGVHRVASDTTSLKSREFCARGLPIVLGFNERDFGRDLPFVFHVPANDDPIDIASLVDWFDGLRIRFPNYPGMIRAYAEQQLTWKIKLLPVISHLRETMSVDTCQA